MARNWGGDGIEKFLNPGERIILRFGNYFLTDSRLGIYHTVNSDFEFFDLSDLIVKENKGKFLKAAMVILVAGFFISFAVLVVLFPKDFIYELAFIFIYLNTILYGYYVLSKYRKGSCVVSSPKTNRSMILRTFRRTGGLAFIEELTRAAKINKMGMD